jgi:hypothetical protein
VRKESRGLELEHGEIRLACFAVAKEIFLKYLVSFKLN